MSMETTHTPQPGSETATTTSRRSFLSQAGLAGLALGSLSAANAWSQDSSGEAMGSGAQLFPGAVSEDGQYQLPPLPYAYDALEPHIDAETMTLHHDRHHQGYVNGLINAEKGLAEARASGDTSNVKHLVQAASFHGGGHFLHCIFWANMSPDPGAPSEALTRQINQDFGSREKLEAEFSAASKSVEGSGWGILAWSIPARRLVVLQAEKHNLLTQWANIPLMVVDVWEHAYYKKYGPGRGDYVSAFLKVANWKSISERYEMAAGM